MLRLSNTRGECNSENKFRIGIATDYSILNLSIYCLKDKNQKLVR